MAIISSTTSVPQTNPRWTRDALAGVWKTTAEAIKNKGYFANNGEKLPLPERNEFSWLTKEWGGVNQCYVYDQIKEDRVEPKFNQTEIVVVDQDCLDAAQSEVTKGRKPAVLNFADALLPGGGMVAGSNAQEEDLCRRSELGGMMLSQKNSKEPMTLYPIVDKLIYTSDLTVFRAGRLKNYEFLTLPFKAAFLSSAAPDLQGMHGKHIEKKDGKICYCDPDTEKYVRKLAYTQLYAAYQNGNDSVILGAFGCGAFCNPPDAVSKIYKDLLDNEFKGAFKSVVFAILDDKNSSGKPHGPEGSFIAFKKCFNQK